MASVFTHAFFALALGKLYAAASEMPARFWVLSAVCAVVPDADVVAFIFGVPYGDVLGHRGLTHSLVFALLAACAVVAVFFRGGDFKRELKREFKKGALVVYFFLVTASHGALDALTNGGLGVAFFAPFNSTRYFFPWRPLVVSPIGVGSFFSEWGLAVVVSEFVRVWLPSLLLVGAVLLWRRARRASGGDD